jgi:hypothetical protein
VPRVTNPRTLDSSTATIVAVSTFVLLIGWRIWIVLMLVAWGLGRALAWIFQQPLRLCHYMDRYP